MKLCWIIFDIVLDFKSGHLSYSCKYLWIIFDLYLILSFNFRNGPSPIAFWIITKLA